MLLTPTNNELLLFYGKCFLYLLLFLKQLMNITAPISLPVLRYSVKFCLLSETLFGFRPCWFCTNWTALTCGILMLL